jgi:hypothetical protein
MKRFIGMQAVTVVACWSVLAVFAGTVQASFFDISFDVGSPDSTAGPTYPSTPLQVNGFKPGLIPIPVEIVELSLKTPTPPELSLSILGSDSGDPDGGSGLESFFDVQSPSIVGPNSGDPGGGPSPQSFFDVFFDVFFALKAPDGMPAPTLVGPPRYENASPFFDVFFNVVIPGEGIFRHQLHGELAPAQPLALLAVNDGGSPATDSFFDVFFDLEVLGDVDPGVPFLRMTLTAERVVPEPAGLGLLGVALLAVRKRRRA